MADAPHADLGFGPSILPPTKLPPNVAPAFSSGPDIGRVDSGKIVAYAIRVRSDLKVGDRDFSGEICLHELVIMRRFYEEVNGGSIQANPAWPPAHPRLVPLNQEQLKTELNRMLTNFVVPRANSVFVVPTAFLGTEPAEQLKRLHTVMQKQLEAWAKVVEVARKRLDGQTFSSPHWELVAAFDHITARELEEVANIADPSRDGVGDLELPEALLTAESASTVPEMIAAGQLTPDAAMAQINAESQAPDAQQALVDRLVAKADLNQQQALAVATLVELMEDTEIADGDLADAIGSKAKSRLDAVRRALKPA